MDKIITRDIVNNILSIVQNLDDVEEAKEYTRIYLKALRNAGLDERLSDDWIYWNLKKVDVRFDSTNDYADDDINEDEENEEQFNTENVTKITQTAKSIIEDLKMAGSMINGIELRATRVTINESLFDIFVHVTRVPEEEDQVYAIDTGAHLD